MKLRYFPGKTNSLVSQKPLEYPTIQFMSDPCYPKTMLDCTGVMAKLQKLRCLIKNLQIALSN